MNKNDEFAVYVLLFASLFLFVAASFPLRMFFPVLLLIVVASLPVWLALVILKRRGYPGPDEWGTKLIHILEKRQDTFFFRLAVFIASFFIYPAGICQVWSYRLIGVRATYRWGHMKARPLAQISQGQRMFAEIFPPIVFTAIAVLMGIIEHGWLTTY